MQGERTPSGSETIRDAGRAHALRQRDDSGHVPRHHPRRAGAADSVSQPRSTVRRMHRSRTVDRSSRRRASPRLATIRAYEPERIIGHWWCPVCGAEAHRLARPGRPKVYCSNACRQRAYRWRRHERSSPWRSPTSDLVRGHTHDRSHAVRPAPDLVSGQRDTRGREITLCGAFARPASRPRWTHTQFVQDVPWACRSCASLAPTEFHAPCRE
jgi:hypothetical protein